MKNPLKRLLPLFLGVHCPLCQRVTANERALCAVCWSKLHFIEEPFCRQLALPMPYQLKDNEEQVSPDALLSPPRFNEARSAVIFNEASRRLIHGLKYQDKQDLVPLLGNWMLRAGVDVINRADLLIPVPMHRSRFFFRQFNQSAELARFISKATGKAFENKLLLRVKRTTPQVGLTHYERAHNLDLAFETRYKSVIEGKNILLIDDVITTGATLNICAETLYQAGAKEVNVLTALRVLNESQKDA